MPETTQKRQTLKAWAGFTDDELYFRFEQADYGGQILPAIYHTRAIAERAFEDVREIEITWQGRTNDAQSRTTDLLDRLRWHSGPAIMGCTCRSDLPNCPSCDCGHAADEIERLRTELSEAEAALEKLING